jgi:hypothetical protein
MVATLHSGEINNIRVAMIENILIYGIVVCVMYLVFSKPKKQYTQSNKDEVLHFVAGRL